jgi:hypothetical protein
MVANVPLQLCDRARPLSHLPPRFNWWQIVKKPRGGSGNNPYLAARNVVTYTEVIEPLSLGRRLLDIREQLAKELLQVSGSYWCGRLCAKVVAWLRCWY